MILARWKAFSKKLVGKIENPEHAGFFTQGDIPKGVRLVLGSEGDLSEGLRLTLFLLVAEDDGVIADIKFQAFGPPTLMGAAEIACELLRGKNYDQARRVTAELIDAHVREKTDKLAFPQEAAAHLNLVLSAIDTVADQCMDIPIADGYIASPLSLDPSTPSNQATYPGWEQLPTVEKIGVIEGIIDKEIRPYVELDAGGLSILNLINEYEVIIAYQGSCTSCHAATGSTLSAIQQILRMKVHPNIIVTPDMSFLSPIPTA